MARNSEQSLQQSYLRAMGIQAWQHRVSADSSAETVLSPATDVVRSGKADTEEDTRVLNWEGLQARVANCSDCALHRERTQAVFGVGNRDADWLIVGEAPGAEEDRQGEPFVGRAGQLLNAMLRAIGLRREEVYIANILKCRPPNNRDPRPEEVACCEPYLKRQVELLQPKIILAVGRIAAQNLLKIDTRIGAMRGHCYAYGDTKIPLVVTYHPAYLLRSPKEKRKAWQDLQLAQRIYNEMS